MFQKNLDYHHNKYYQEFALDIRDLLIHDPEFDAYVKANKPRRDGRGIDDNYLSQCFNSFINDIKDPELKEIMKPVCDLLNELNKFDDNVGVNLDYDYSEPSNEPGKGENHWRFGRIWDDVVYKINLLGGYEVATKYQVTTMVHHDTLIKKQPSIMEQIHAKFNNDGYNAIYKNNPQGKLIMRFGQIADSFMTELSKFALEANIANFREGYLKDISKEKLSPEKKLMEEISELKETITIAPEGGVTNLITADNPKFVEYLSKLREKNNELEKQRLANDEEIKAKLEKDELVVKQINDKAIEILFDIHNEIPSPVEDEVAQALKKYEEEKAEIEIINRQIEEMNADAKINNDKIEAQINEIEENRKGKLAEVDAVDADIFEKKERAAWEKRRDQAMPRLEEAKAEKAEVEKKLTYLKEGVEAGIRTQSPKYYNIPDEHFENVEKENKNIAAFEQITLNLYEISGNDRYAAGLMEKITPDVVKEYKSITKKLAECQKKIAEFNTNDPSKVEEQIEQLQPLSVEMTDLKDRLEKMGPAAKALEALDTWRKENPDLAKEFDNLKKSQPENSNLTDYQLLDRLSNNHKDKLKEIKNEYKAYYDDKITFEKFQRDGRDLNEHDLTEQFKSLKLELDKLEIITSEEEFKKDLQDKLVNYKSKKECDEMRDTINKTADANIEELKKHIVEYEELRFPTPQNVIDEEIATIRRQGKAVYEAKCGVELKKRMVPERELILNEAMRKYRDNIRAQQDKLHTDENKLMDLRDKSRQIYEHSKHINESIPKLNEMWKSMKPTAESPISMLESRLNMFVATVDNGKSKNHTDTQEFKDMRDAVTNLQLWMRNNGDKLKDGDKEVRNQFKTKLGEVKEVANVYVGKKQEGIHIFSSKMRFARLQFADDLMKFCDDAGIKADQNVELIEKREEMSNEVSKFVDNVKQIPNFPDYKSYISLCELRYTKAPTNEIVVEEPVKVEVKEQEKEQLISTDPEPEKEELLIEI